MGFGAIAVFTILAGVIGIFAFANSWAAIDHITRSRLPTLTIAHQLARQSKAIAATAPTLLVAKVQSQRLTASDRITDQTRWLEELVGKLRQAGVGSLAAIEREEARLLQSFRKLDQLVEAHIAARIGKDRAALELVASYRAFKDAVESRTRDDRAESAASTTPSSALGAAVANSLLAAAHAARPEHLKEIEKEFLRATRQWEATLAAASGEVEPGILETFERIARFGTDPDNLFQLRARELEAGAIAQRFQYVYNQNANRLAIAASNVVESVQADIAFAARTSHADLIRSGSILFFIALVCVSGAIALSLQIARNIGGRLAALGKSMEVHAAGGTCEIPSGGDDEIARMSGALRSFIETIGHREEALRESEKRFRQMAEQIKDVFWMHEVDTGAVVYASPAYETIWGRSLELAYENPETWIESVHPEDRQRVIDNFHEMLQGNPYEEEYRITLPDGSIRWIRDRGFPVEDEDGRIYRLAGLAQDITERKRAEDALIETNRALKTLSSCNEALLRATTESELLNEICRIIVEVGGYRFAWVGAAENDAAKTVRPVARFGYEEGYLETRPVIWADNDKGQGPTGIAIRSGKPSVEGNILESPSLEPWHAAMVERRYAGIAVLPLLADAKAFAALNIYASEPDAFDRNEVRLLTELANNLSYGIMALRGAAERKLAQKALGESERALQERVADLEEAQRRLELQGADLVRSANDLGDARDQAEAANQAKSEFLANMSHELRTPLNAIVGFSEIMKQETMGPVGNARYLEYANDIHRAGHHLLDLINDILDLSKVESGKDELHEETLEIGDLVDSVRVLVSGRAEREDIALRFDLEDLPALRADARKLKQILVNLLSNAIKFTETGGRVTFRAWTRADSGLVFQIVDTGIGIASDDIPKALAPFRQIEGALARKYPGTGLGLPLAKALVEMHGGTLDLQSELGVGTTVTVRFPAERIVVPEPLARKRLG